MALTPIKAIRAKCLDCCNQQTAEVRLCPSKTCSLYPYRMGRRPKREIDTPEDASNENSADSPHFFCKEG